MYELSYSELWGLNNETTNPQQVSRNLIDIIHFIENVLVVFESLEDKK